jgi:predicted heme/steroid binding protein
MDIINALERLIDKHLNTPERRFILPIPIEEGSIVPGLNSLDSMSDAYETRMPSNIMRDESVGMFVNSSNDTAEGKRLTVGRKLFYASTITSSHDSAAFKRISEIESSAEKNEQLSLTHIKEVESPPISNAKDEIPNLILNETKNTVQLMESDHSLDSLSEVSKISANNDLNPSNISNSELVSIIIQDDPLILETNDLSKLNIRPNHSLTLLSEAPKISSNNDINPFTISESELASKIIQAVPLISEIKNLSELNIGANHSLTLLSEASNIFVNNDLNPSNISDSELATTIIKAAPLISDTKDLSQLSINEEDVSGHKVDEMLSTTDKDVSLNGIASDNHISRHNSILTIDISLINENGDPKAGLIENKNVAPANNDLLIQPIEPITVIKQVEVKDDDDDVSVASEWEDKHMGEYQAMIDKKKEILSEAENILSILLPDIGLVKKVADKFCNHKEEIMIFSPIEDPVIYQLINMGDLKVL